MFIFNIKQEMFFFFLHTLIPVVFFLSTNLPPFSSVLRLIWSAYPGISGWYYSRARARVRPCTCTWVTKCRCCSPGPKFTYRIHYWRVHILAAVLKFSDGFLQQKKRWLKSLPTETALNNANGNNHLRAEDTHVGLGNQKSISGGVNIEEMLMAEK